LYAALPALDGHERAGIVVLHHRREPVEDRSVGLAQLAAGELEVNGHVELEHALHLLHADVVLAPERLQLLLERVETPRVIGDGLIGGVDAATDLPVAGLHLFAELGDLRRILVAPDFRGAPAQSEQQADRPERGSHLHAAMPCNHPDLPLE
jgi:hypothetical protein